MSAGIAFLPFDALSGRDVHDLLKLRADVFVIEQQSLFGEIDGRDPAALHGFARDEVGLAGACRILDLDGDAPPSLGRIVVRPDRRGSGLGSALIRAALGEIAVRAPGREVRLGAQKHLLGYYAGFGFVPDSGEYDDGGIPHVDMALRAGAVHCSSRCDADM